MSWDSTTYNAAARALGDQGYRRVILDGISPDVTFPSTGSPEVDGALIGAKQTPNWAEIARQLLQFSFMGGFQSAHVRRDGTDFEVVILQAFTGQLALATAQREFEHAWPIVDQLGKEVTHFALSERTKGEVKKVLDAWGASAQPPQAAGGLANDPNLDPAARAQPNAAAQNPTLHIVLALLSLIWDIATCRGTTAVLLIAGAEGLAPDLSARLENVLTPWQKEALSLSAPRTLACVGLDCIQERSHGHTQLASLKLDRLNESYAYHLRQLGA
jgi:hypothetical protein